MKLMRAFFRAYPKQMSMLLVALLFAGIAEGIGLSAMLPLLNIAVKNDAAISSEVTTSVPDNEFERVVLDSLDNLGLQPDIGTLLLIIVSGITFKIFLLLIAQKKIGYTSAQIATDLRLEMLRAILKCRWEYFLHQPVGKLTNALATEAQRSADTFVNGATVLTYLIQALIYFFVALAVSWQATLVGLLAGLTIIGISYFLVRMARKAGNKQTRLNASLLAGLTDTLQSVKPLKAMSRESLADSVLAMETTKLNKALQKQVFSTALMGAGQEQMYTLVIALGMYVALAQLTMPITTVLVLAIVLGRMLGQLGKVQKQYQKMVVGESAYWSMRAAIQKAQDAEEDTGPGKQPTLKQGITLSNVDFSYATHPILTQANLEIPAAKLTTLIGPSGSGKTTIVDLVIGLLRPGAGQVLIDGIPLSKLELRSWREMIGYVPQETILLHDSILHNVTLGDDKLSESDAERALRAAGAWEFVQKIPNGMHSSVGERGSMLSGGQRQRVVIARALVNRPKLLIMDEATSALDPASEAAISKTMEKLSGKLTILAISHQTALVESADRVYRLGNQAVVEEAANRD